jgi:hypothetical protein
MARPLDEIVRLDRLWFWAHPERSHRCRRPDTRELALCDSNRGVPLVIAIRHLGRGPCHLSASNLSWHAAQGREIGRDLVCSRSEMSRADPSHSEIDVLRLQRGVRLPQIAGRVRKVLQKRREVSGSCYAGDVNVT